MENTLLFVIGQLIACTCMVWWFQTSLPVGLTKLLRSCGWKRHESDFWPEELDYKYWYRQAWEKWLTMNDHIPAVVRDGVTCPGCMSLHLSYVAAALLAFEAPLWLCLLGAVSWPYGANLGLSLIRRLNRP